MYLNFVRSLIDNFYACKLTFIFNAFQLKCMYFLPIADSSNVMDISHISEDTSELHEFLNEEEKKKSTPVLQIVKIDICNEETHVNSPSKSKKEMSEQFDKSKSTINPKKNFTQEKSAENTSNFLMENYLTQQKKHQSRWLQPHIKSQRRQSSESPKMKSRRRLPTTTKSGSNEKLTTRSFPKASNDINTMSETDILDR